MIFVSPATLAARQLAFRLDSANTRIWFDADASLGKFHGDARRFTGEAGLADAASVADATGTIIIEVASFETGNGMRDGHLRSDMDARAYPTITFELRAVDTSGVVDAVASADIPDAATLDRAAILRGELTIHGERREVGIPVRFRVDADSLRVAGTLPIRFTDFAMKPPSRLFGTVKVHDDLVLGFDALFLREET